MAFFGEKKLAKTKCCVPGCSNRLNPQFRFPNKNDKRLFQTWLDKINNKTLMALSFDEIYNKYRVCFKHFLPEQILEPRRKRGVTYNAVPSLLLAQGIVRNW